MSITTSSTKRALIIGAGPAGLTAAYELLERTAIVPILLEQSEYLGGLSRTVNYKGNRIDIGGHRFFSKSDRVMNWWLNILPLAAGTPASVRIAYQGQTAAVQNHSAEAQDPDRVMLLRKRKSRIYFVRQFFSYPISSALKPSQPRFDLYHPHRSQLSPRAAVPDSPRKQSRTVLHQSLRTPTLSDLFQVVHRKSVGLALQEISAEWGAQRIKGLSILKTISHMLKRGYGQRPRTKRRRNFLN